MFEFFRLQKLKKNRKRESELFLRFYGVGKRFKENFKFKVEDDKRNFGGLETI